MAKDNPQHHKWANPIQSVQPARLVVKDFHWILNGKTTNNFMISHWGDKGAGQHQNHQCTEQDDGCEEDPVNGELILREMTLDIIDLHGNAQSNKQKLQETSDWVCWALVRQAQGRGRVLKGLGSNGDLIVVHSFGFDAVVVVANPAYRSSWVGNDFVEVAFDVRGAAERRHSK